LPGRPVSSLVIPAKAGIHLLFCRIRWIPGAALLSLMYPVKNRNYADILLDYGNQALMDKVKIIGRAVWWCHDEIL
jgi:hypothetical protein